MSFKKIMIATAAAALSMNGVFAADAPAAAPAPAAPAAPAAPKFKVDELLALIPEFVGEYTDGGKVVKVDTAVMKAGLKAELEMAAKQGADIRPDMIKQLLGRLGEQLVMQKVMPLAAAKKGFKPDMEKIKADLADFKKNQLGGDEKKYKDFLTQQGCKDEQALIDKVAPTQAVQAYVKSIEDEATKNIDDAAVKAAFDKQTEGKTYYTCSHILAAFNPEDPRAAATPEQEAAALKKIKDIQDKLNKGAKFEDLAKELSDCPSGKNSNGKLQDYDPAKKMPEGQMVPEFTKAFNALKPGETTAEPVKTQFGYHIIKASAVQQRKLEEVADMIRMQLKNEAMQKRIPALLDEIKKEFKVTIYKADK